MWQFANTQATRLQDCHDKRSFLEMNMASNKRPSGNSPDSSPAVTAAHSAAAHTLGSPADWMSNSFGSSQAGLEWINQFQLSFLQAAIKWQEALTQALGELQKTKNPLEYMSQEANASNTHFEAFAAQASGLLQQLFDSQLQLHNRMLKNSDPAEIPSPAAQAAPALLKAWGQAQDDWLKVTRSWIDTANQLKR
jgi:hypothetical protein